MRPSTDAGSTTRGRRLVNGQISTLANRLHISPSKIIRRANIGPTISTQHGANVGMPTATFDQPYRPCTNVGSTSCCWLGISSLVILCTCTYICESMLLFDDIWWCLFCTRPIHSVDCFYIANLYIMYSYSFMNVCMVSIKYQFIVFSLIRRCGWRFDHVISIKKT